MLLLVGNLCWQVHGIQTEPASNPYSEQISQLQDAKSGTTHQQLLPPAALVKNYLRGVAGLSSSASSAQPDRRCDLPRHDAEDFFKSGAQKPDHPVLLSGWVPAKVLKEKWRDGGFERTLGGMPQIVKGTDVAPVKAGKCSRVRNSLCMCV